MSGQSVPERAYAPAREDGRYPYVVERSRFGRKTERIVWASDLKEAKRLYGWTREHYVALKVRRALVRDMHQLPDTSAPEGAA